MSLRAEHIRFSYGNHEVLKGITLQAEYGELLSILGPNGSGKSTLFRCLIGALKPSDGTILVDEVDVSGMSVQERARKIAYIPQAHHPVFDYTVAEMILMGTASEIGFAGRPGPMQYQAMEEAAEKLGICHLKERSYRSISGGEQQMVLIARALAQRARILIMDEPASSLDPGNRFVLMQVLRRLKEEGYAIIQSTHDPDLAYRYSEKILMLKNGQMLGYGCPEEMITAERMSRLYGMHLKVVETEENTVRVTLPYEE